VLTYSPIAALGEGLAYYSGVFSTAVTTSVNPTATLAVLSIIGAIEKASYYSPDNEFFMSIASFLNNVPVVREAANLPISNPYAAVFLTLVAATMIVLHSIGECKLVSNYSIDKVDKVVGWLGTVMISLMPLVTNDNFDYKRHGKFLVKAGALLPGYFWVIAIVTIVITSIVYSCVYDCVDNLGFICAAIPVKGLNIIEQIVKAILHAGLILLQIFAPAVSFVISIAIAIAGVSLVRVLMRISFYYKEVYVNPVAHFIFRHNKEIPLVHKKLPRKIRKDYENIDLALPVFVLYGVRGVKKRGAIWLVIKGTDHRLIVKRRFKYEDMCLEDLLSSHKPASVEQLKRFIKISSEDKMLQLVISNSYKNNIGMFEALFKGNSQPQDPQDQAPSL